MRSNHIRKITIAVSILLHLIFLASYKDIRHLLVLAPDASLADQEMEKQIVFEFDEPREVVETPDDAIQNAPNERTNMVSDKNSIARDRNADPSLAEGAPYQRGDLSQAHNIHEARSPEFQQEMSPHQQQNDPDADKERQEKQDQQVERDDALNMLNPPEFSRQALIGKQAQRQRREQQQAMYNNEDFSARDVGGLAFNTYAWDFAPYMLHMKRKIQQNIFPPPAFTRMGMISGDVRVRFKVMPNGDVKDLKVLSYRGHESLRETSVKAVENAAAFNPLPSDFPENYLEVTATFSYHIQR